MTVRTPDHVRSLSDRELDFLQQYNTEYTKMSGKCPTCRGNGHYAYDGEDLPCPTDIAGRDLQLYLFKIYCMADIPYQYQILDWSLYPHTHIVDKIENYIDNFDDYLAYGIGMEIYGENLAVGKTWTAVHILKELIKLGYSGWYAEFNDIKNMWQMYEDKERAYRTERLLKSSILVLDEIGLATTDRSERYFEDKLEWVIRHRTNRNLPTIITTNALPEDLSEQFPRVHSLLAAKQERLELKGRDYRINSGFVNNKILADAGERVPVT